jgi:hypothetical protein
MGQINVARVVGGGLLAGLIMNVSEFVLHAVVLADDGAGAWLYTESIPGGEATP